METVLEVSTWVKRVEARGWGLKNIQISCFPNDYSTWDSYIANMSEGNRRYMKVLFEEIKKDGIFMSGHGHRFENFGTPVFSDNKFIVMKDEEWECLMVLMWSKIHNKNYKSFLDLTIEIKTMIIFGTEQYK